MALKQKLKLLFKPKNLPLTLSLLVVLAAIPLTVGLAVTKTLYDLSSQARGQRKLTKPVCIIRLRNRKASDGWWRWQDQNKKIKYNYEKSCKSKNCQAVCKNIGKRTEGWYSRCKDRKNDRLIVRAKCGPSTTPKPTPTPTPPSLCPPSSVDLKISEENLNLTSTGLLFGTFNIIVNQIVSLSLEENASTGYRWEIKADSKYLKLLCQLSSASECRSGEKCPPIVGAPTTITRYYQVLESGNTSITGIYCRPWECEKTTEKKLNITLTTFPKTTPSPLPTSTPLSTPIPSPPYKCTDSDGGLNYNEQGTCKDNNAYRNGATDHCQDDDGVIHLYEMYCHPGLGQCFSAPGYVCPTGYTCSNGTCVPSH